MSATEHEAALDLEAYFKHCHDAAVHFLDECSIEPKPEVVAQLTEAFLPCLQVIASRHYRQDGAQWRGLGWRGILHEMMKRMQRLEHSSWDNDVFDANAATDMINFCGYYLRLRNQGRPFGNRNDPGAGGQ